MKFTRKIVTTGNFSTYKFKYRVTVFSESGKEIATSYADTVLGCRLVARRIAKKYKKWSLESITEEFSV